jgi:hypothetical protein
MAHKPIPRKLWCWAPELHVITAAHDSSDRLAFGSALHCTAEIQGAIWICLRVAEAGYAWTTRIKSWAWQTSLDTRCLASDRPDSAIAKSHPKWGQNN